MTERAGEITPPEKDQGSDPARKVEQARPLETFEFHLWTDWILFLFRLADQKLRTILELFFLSLVPLLNRAEESAYT